MNWMLQIKEAFSNITSAKLRSFLAVLGILVGTGSVVAMVSGGQLAAAHALNQFSELGTDLLSLSIYASGDGGGDSKVADELTATDIDNLKKSVPEIKEIAPYTTIYNDVSYEGNGFKSSIIGSVNSLADVIKINVTQGRFISNYDGASPFCVIGYKIADMLKEFGVKNPIKKELRVGDRYFTIIGVAGSWRENSFFNQDVNKSIMIPLHSSQLISEYANINNVVMQMKPDINIDTVQDDIKSQLEKVATGKRFFLRSAKQLINSMISQRNTMTLLLALIGSISLLVGGIGVMNIMLVSVVERRREIGIRKAVGARSKDIRHLFLVESVALSLFGGILGVFIGILASFIIATLAEWKFEIFIMPPLIGFGVSVAVGIFFGFYPAYQASKLDPIQTLRSD